jgi:hypothetical protein
VQTAAQRVFNRIDAPFCESWREKHNHSAIC